MSFFNSLLVAVPEPAHFWWQIGRLDRFQSDSVMHGHRLACTGADQASPDAEVIPPGMLERVAMATDGRPPAECCKRHSKLSALRLDFGKNVWMVSPNAVADPVQTRRELIPTIERARAVIKALINGLDAIDVALKLLRADKIKPKPMCLPPAHPAAKGKLSTVLDRLTKQAT